VLARTDGRSTGSMTKLAGRWEVVLRARCDWQRFLANRPMYGGIYDWHTLEGPCVRKHADRYYCFYSGGRWETENYGVGLWSFRQHTRSLLRCG
jgi:hypothetical protein